MQSSEIRSRFIAFFAKRGHAIIPSASLVPENDPSVLFNTAGMQPLVPYLLGTEHPMGKRIADIQKCVRTGDLDDIGDNRHFSFFEMLGNWSLGDYFKEEAITWSYEFLTSQEEGLGLDLKRLYVTIFEGDENASLDEESKKIWMQLGIPENRIYALPADDNWWSPGENGPCGACSEMFYDMSGTTGDLSRSEFIDAVKSEAVIEIWNDVFMEYEKQDGKVIGKLKQRNVDTGAGLERMTAVMQGVQTAYDTDLFAEVFAKIDELATKDNLRAKRIIADHMRTAVMMMADGVTPSNTDRGYVLRRLLRRAVRYADVLGIKEQSLYMLTDVIQEEYKDIYPEVANPSIKSGIDTEENKFRETLKQGMREIDKAVNSESTSLNAQFFFDLFQTHGFPFELAIEEINSRRSQPVPDDVKKHFHELFKAHQEKSRTASAGMFKGGLANHNEQTIKLHTAHHLLLAALQQVLGKEVKQRGSNITEERLRIDFVFDRKMTDEEKKKVEDIVNGYITQDLTVERREMPRDEAEKLGAEMEFGAKYPDIVSVYVIEDKTGTPISKEFCGGPHVAHTGLLGHFVIQKEEASSAGVRRIKALLE